MYRETHYLDDLLTKASGFINVGSGIPKSKFTAHEEAKMLRLLDQLWGQQFDKATQARVLEAMQIGDLPAGFLSDIDGSLTQWVESQFMPAYAKAMEYAAEGGGQVFGMMDDINHAVGGNILFNPSTQRMTDYINTHGLELAKQLNDGQVASLRTMLNDVLENNLTQRRAHDLMRKSISLTDQETKWLTNYRTRTLDEQTKYFRKEFPNLNEREILKRANAVTDRRVAIKHKKYQSNRARRIMDTELTDAKHTADLESHKQAMDAGIIKEAQKKWQRNNYEDNWDTSKWYDGKRIPIDQDFSQFGIPAKTSMTDFSMPREINENCKVIFYVKKGDGVPKPKPEAVKPKPKPRIKPKPKPKPKKAEFKPAKSIDEAERFARENLDINVKYSKFDLDKANTINETFNEYFTKFPELKGKTNFIGDIQSQASHAVDRDNIKSAFNLKKMAHSKSTGAVYSKPNKSFGFINNKDLLNQKAINKDILYQVQQEWHAYASKNNPFASTVDHEFGHFLDDTFDLYNNKEIKNVWNKLNEMDISDGLSGYGSTNLQEFIAESWREFRGSPSPRKISKDVGNIIMKFLGG